jgi:lipopolysaccharide/colanic/teichoic acid biosynthesis glycosyltransferase
MVKVNKVGDWIRLGIACASSFSTKGNILMHHTRIEIQKAYSQYIKFRSHLLFSFHVKFKIESAQHHTFNAKSVL